MNILYIAADAMNITDFIWAYMEMGHKVQTLDIRNIPLNKRASFLDMNLNNCSFHFVITNNFITSVSEACQKKHIPYVSWNFDAPVLAHYSQAAKHEYNYIFTFDKNEYLALKSLSLPHVYHQPLCINPSRIGAIEITPEDENTFSSDISFVGSLYEDNFYNTHKDSIPSCHIPTLELILKRFHDDYCSHSVEKAITTEETSLLNSLFPSLDKNTTSLDNKRYLYHNIISPKMTELDRIRILNHLARKYHVSLYTNSPSELVEHVDVHGSVNYDTIMNKIFYLSKINLNITFRQITSGIPQRVFDIMACGGFVVTNHQSELYTYFQKGQDLEVFETLQELDEIVDYYLHHEKERIQIAMNGYKKVISHHTYKQRAQTILNILSATP